MLTVETEPELIEVVRHLDAAGEPVLILGGGSNVLIGMPALPAR
jgi:UDP-N-acetylmuramate dehydrogenase